MPSGTQRWPPRYARRSSAGTSCPTGRLTSDAPTAYALALAFDLLPPDLRDAAGERLATLVEDGGDVVATGFVGTPVVLDALSSTGHLDRAYALLMQTACPSWLYMVGQGATTMWERWDSILPDGTVNPGDMTSFNHYALGSVADWLHGTVAGLRQTSPVGDTFDIAPRPGGGLSWAQAWLETAFGRAEVAWNIEGRRVAITATVPIGARARVDLGSAGIVDLTCRTPRALRRPRPADRHLSTIIAATPPHRGGAFQLCPRRRTAAAMRGLNPRTSRAICGLTALTGSG